MPIAEKSYDVMYPGRFLRSADLDGKVITVTIADINAEELEADKNKKKREYIITFVGKKKAFVLNKTNGFLLFKLFGKNPNEWRGKRVTIYPTKCRFGPDMVDCIRVFGSPDIAEDTPVQGKIGRSTLKATLHAVKGTVVVPTEAPAAEDDPEPPSQDILDAWSILGWTATEGHKSMSEYLAVEPSRTIADYLGKLNMLIDEMDSKEAF